MSCWKSGTWSSTAASSSTSRRRPSGRAYRLNKTIWDAHGGNFSPVGVGVSNVEKSYPLAQMIARITAPGSPIDLKRAEG
jgi:hypothetical protein